MLGLLSCQQQTVYEVEPFTVQQPSASKLNLKSDQEFISIAYKDLFDAEIATNDLNTLMTAYASVGDKSVVIDRIIRNFLKRNGVKIPTKTQMRSNIPAFVEGTYKRFYGRKPTEMEAWYLTNFIQQDTTLSPQIIYYSFLTSDEYRFY
ncbi:MAG: hypothetical protein NZ108_02715 [Bacteroidia bacterium]|nr:hypothetical protein [Bacteroidia bacterium]